MINENQKEKENKKDLTFQIKHCPVIKLIFFCAA